MATANHVLLRRITLNAATASVTFDSIPQTGYTDLKVVMSVRGTKTGTGQGLYMSINGLTTNRFWRWLYGSGSGAGSGSGSDSMVGNMNASGATASTFSNIEIYLHNYTSGNHKLISTDAADENNATSAFTEMLSGVWSSNSAITSITFTPEANNFDTYCTFSLYGIADVNTTPTGVPKASGGDIIKTDGTYWYHTFLSSGIFKPDTTLSADCLVIAGGGAGGTNYGAGGGGGAGGLLYSSQSLPSLTAQVITIGAGASIQGALNTPSTSGSGSNSTVGSLLTAIGGGGGASYNATPGTGGSGGGAGGADSSQTGGAGTSGQGYAGGNTTVIQYAAAGGGGAGGVGSNNSSGPTGGNGGPGVNTYSAWATATGTGVSGYYAGGGGAGAGGPSSPFSGTAGTGGAGGGGNGASGSSNASNGVANTGGGGGGIRQGNVSGNGGSGIVIIRYAV